MGCKRNVNILLKPQTSGTIWADLNLFGRFILQGRVSVCAQLVKVRGVSLLPEGLCFVFARLIGALIWTLIFCQYDIFFTCIELTALTKTSATCTPSTKLILTASKLSIWILLLLLKTTNIRLPLNIVILRFTPVKAGRCSKTRTVVKFYFLS